MLAIPKFLVLDSSSLGVVARDYWSAEATLRDKSRFFLSGLMDRGVHVALTLTQISELLRHDNQEVRKDRLRFLRSLQLVAWLRPYDGTWFPGGAPHLLARELHALVHDSCLSWRDIIANVRPRLWETGVGADMFVEDERLWSAIHAEARRHIDHERLVASVARTDAGRIHDLKLGNALRLPRRPKEERAAYMQRFAVELERQLERHGDKQLTDPVATAADFVRGTLRQMEQIDALGGDPAVSILEHLGVPAGWVQPEMTIGELGELGIYAQRIRMVLGKLKPAARIRVADIAPDALPSHVVERKLAEFQTKEDRVKGSDLGDGHLAPLALYADAVQVDKRTLHHLTRVCQRNPQLASLMRPVFRSPDYKDIPARFDT